MAKAMRHRDLKRALLQQGCRWRQGKGDHEVWYCPCGEHTATVTQVRVVSPGVVAQAIRNLGCLPKGWWQ
jgi:hypothetical protein